MFYIAHAHGFLSDVWTTNGIRKPRFVSDIRKAMAFSTVKDAEEAFKNCTYGKHFCILSNSITYKTPHYSEAPEVPVQVAAGLVC